MEKELAAKVVEIDSHASADIATYPAFLAGLLAEHHLKTLAPIERTTEEGFAPPPTFKVDVSGKGQDLMGFLDALSKSPGLANVHDLRLEFLKDSPGDIKALFKMSVFRFRQD